MSVDVQNIDEILESYAGGSRQRSRAASADIQHIDEDKIDIAELEMKEQSLFANAKSVSFLDPSVIRWVHKHKNPMLPAQSNQFVPPSKALQLKSIFNGLDFDNSG